jgi:hypothetical protein
VVLTPAVELASIHQRQIDVVSLRTLSVIFGAATLLAACGNEREPDTAELSGPAESAVGTSAAPTTIVPEGSPSSTTEDVTVSTGNATLSRCSEVPALTTGVLGDHTSDNFDAVFRGVLQTYAAEHEDTFGGMWIDRDAYGTIVLAFTDQPAAHRAALAQRRPSPDDMDVIDPPPEITDDRPIGEWDLAFDVVQVAYTEAELIAAVGPVVEAAQAVVQSPVGGSFDVQRNRVNLELAVPTTPSELDAIADSVAAGGIDPEIVCWSGQFVDEAPEPIQPGTPLDVIELPDVDGTYPADTPVECGGLRFEVGDLAAPTPAADVEPGLRAVLDGALAGPEGEFMPGDGWSLLTENGEHATFIHIGDGGVSYIGAEMGSNGWIWAGSGAFEACDVRLALPDGLGSVEWMLDPAAPAPDATSTDLRVLVSERGCAGGQEMGARLLGPQVVVTDDAVRIAFAAVLQPGAQTCPGNPSTPVTVTLETPLGDREIRDGLAIGSLASLTGN